MKRGYLYAGAAYVLWGLFPLYWKLLLPAGPVEILAHRMVWSMVFTGVLLLTLSRFGAIRRLLRDRRAAMALAGAGVFISLNWGTYIYGVNAGQVVETSLGYFLNPLVTVLMGVLVLKERLRRLQWIAVVVGALALIVLTLDYGRIPWIALVLGFSFAFYGLIKKQVKVAALEGLFAETAVVVIPAIGFLAWLSMNTRSSVRHRLMGAHPPVVGRGPGHRDPAAVLRRRGRPPTDGGVGDGAVHCAVTAVSDRGVVVFGEAMSVVRWIGFGIVWLALVLFSVDALTQHRRRAATAIAA